MPAGPQGDGRRSLFSVSRWLHLTELQQHAEVLTACPGRWMSWNYRDATI